MLLTLNCWSSSIKYAIFDDKLTCISKGNSENVKDHQKELQNIIKKLKLDKKNTKLRIAHRVVHGWKIFKKSTIITNKNIKKLEALNTLAPLHNPIQTKCIEFCLKLFPKSQNIAVFDTAFFQTFTPEHYRYALPSDRHKTYNIRKYGFHGISHQYLIQETIKKFHTKNLKIITCHLGNGASITASKDGLPITTSMGFTPTGGIVMGTRCWDIDPTIIPYIMQQKKLSATDIDKILTKQSWLLALSETTNDMKTLLSLQKKDPKAKLAIQIFIRRIVETIGSYIALMNGADVIVFSGAIGYRSTFIRNQIKKHFTYLPKIKFLTIETNEELMMAKEAQIVTHLKFDLFE